MMENSNKIIPPHLNAEIYRTDTTGTNTVSYLDYIRIHTDGSLLVGSSELTGRYWNGGINVFQNVAEGQRECKKSKKCISLTSGTADGCFADSSSKIILCEDNGAVSVWATSDDGAWKIWDRKVFAAEHDDAALAIECVDSGKEYITTGADGNVKLWDICDMICIKNYKGAHNMAVYGVAVKPNSKACFATASLDSYVTLWDQNIDKPVTDLVKNNCGVRCLQWLDEYRVVYGDEAGILRLVDIRKTDDTNKLAEFPAAVHKVAVNSGSNKIAVCCDNKIVSVCTVNADNQSSIEYHDRHMHNNYVRGLAWDVNEKNILHTLGWDGEIKTHKICN
ncbi:methylosome protein 50-like [Pectinophora gossypiella]|uniref:methylosome protein 50-like n=1 Tax=Pectinophora gossypiella TaxID=13191 RepID=UPI00214F5C8A|nr:methylosome protein 50-like [Pectinophora gossypiella]